jgi:hypothetical protein
METPDINTFEGRVAWALHIFVALANAVWISLS